MSDRRQKNKDWPTLYDEALDRIKWAMDHPGALPGLPTGIKSLDDAIDGLQPGHVVGIGGATGMGKTCLLLNVAYNVSKSVPVGFISLEQPASELALRIVSDSSGKTLTDLKRGKITSAEFQSLVGPSQQIKSRKLNIRDQFKREFDELQQQISALHENYDLQAVFLDYVQLAKGKDARTRDREIGTVTGGLKELAMNLNIPIVFGSQVNRETRHNEGQRPSIHNLRESGSIEMDSDVILLLHREHYYFKQKKKPDPRNLEESQKWESELAECYGKAEIIVAKNRHGPSGNVLHVAFNDKTMKFSDLVEDAEVR